jgi:transglutaminase-like putative cysteine protease
MLLRIEHETKLHYTEPVAETVFEVRTAPVSTEDQTVLGYRLRITPPAPVTAYRDGFGNRVDLFNILAPHNEIVVRATSYVRVHRRPGRERLANLTWPCEQLVALEALEFLRPSPLVDVCPDLGSFLQDQAARTGPLSDVLERMLSAVGGRLKYEKKVTTAQTPLSEALTLGRGVCQDFAHLMLGACRAIGWPARYVSGYVNHPGEIATHAWCQVWGGAAAGWVDVDPTQGKYIGDDHVVTAVGRDYFDVPPNRGVWKGNAEETITVAVRVESVERMPPDSGELGAAWLGVPSAHFHRQIRVNGLHFQARPAASMRHQQSQQQ